MIKFADRRQICAGTIARSKAIAESTPGGSLHSTFISSQLDPLSRLHPAYPNLTLKSIEVHNSDSFELARTLPSDSGKIGVLNLASDFEPGGGWPRTLSVTQEEALCYSSTLYATLKPKWYPWPNYGPKSCAGIFSPDVVVFRDTLSKNLVEFPVDQRHVVAVMTVAAPCQPKLSESGEEFAKESDLRDFQEKILLTLRMAAVNGVTSLVLGAMGCGAYGCPPKAVAQEMKRALELEEFRGWFSNVVFAVYASGPLGQRNLATFRQVFGQTEPTT